MPFEAALREAVRAGACAAPGPHVQLLQKWEMLRRVGLSFPTVWKMMRAGTFPRSRTVGPQKRVWIENEIEAWIAALPVSRFKDDDEKAA
jgi:prophage regulatory protein